MAIVGRAIRDKAHDDRMARQRCVCGHPPYRHHEWRSTWEIDADGWPMEVRHPNYAVGVFHCDDCDCPSYTHDGVNR